MIVKTAYVYYLEFTDIHNVYLKLLRESIRSVIEYGYCKGSDIYVNYVGYSGTPVWRGDHYEVEVAEEDNYINYLTKLVEEFGINIMDVSEGKLHYVELPSLLNLPLPKCNDIHHFETKDMVRLKFFNHKFTNYLEIIKKGYDKIVQLDADLIFYASNDNFLNSINYGDAETLYFCRLAEGNSVDEFRELVKVTLRDRESNNVQLFSLRDIPEFKNQYKLAKKFIKGILNYNLDNFEDDITYQKFWISGGLGVFSKEFIVKYFETLSFINYFFTKDDEIALMLLCFANNISFVDLDPDKLIGYGRNNFDKKLHIAYHPYGDKDIKKDFIANNYLPV